LYQFLSFALEAQVDFAVRVSTNDPLATRVCPEDYGVPCFYEPGLFRGVEFFSEPKFSRQLVE